MFTFKVVPESGGPFIIKAGTRDVLTWERTTKDKTYADLLREPNLIDYYKIAHLAAWRQGLFTGSLQDFETQHELDLTSDDEVADDEPDPTQPDPSTEPSSTSPSEPGSPRPSGRKKAKGQ